MERKVFLSFLGAYKYDQVDYIYKSVKYKTAYAPVASIYFLGIDGYVPDVYYVFVTEEAKKINLEELKDELLKIGFNINNLIPIDIEKETAETKLWNNYEKVYAVLGVKDVVSFDITYGFRATPMLLTTLLNYAKIMKNITIHKIFYGAYERNQSTANIWDLTDFSLIQDLAVATDEFLKYNVPHKFAKFFPSTLQEKILKFSSIFSTNRSLEIYKADFAVELQKILNKELENKPKAFDELKVELNKRFSLYEKDNIKKNGFLAVEFCIQSNLIQQAITILQELVVTLVAQDIGKDYRNEGVRNVITACLSIRNPEKCEKDKIYKKNLTDDEVNQLISAVFNLKYKKKLTQLFIKFSINIRNDINHAGLRSNPKDGLYFKNKIINYLKDFEKIFDYTF